MRILMLWVSSVLFALATLAAPPADAPGIRWEPYVVKDRSGAEQTWNLGHLKVPQNRHDPDSGTIDLAFLRLESTSAHPGFPIVFLEGGPGQAATPMVRSERAIESLAPLRAIADVILLDQRGTGLSSPLLACRAEAPAPLDVFSDDPAALQAFVSQAARCAARFRSDGVDVAAWNTRESADDLDDLRRALGAERLNLLGFSYGTHLATAAMRRHGDHLERVVLIGTEGPDHTWKLPSTLDGQLEKLSLLVADDPTVAKAVPDFAALTRRVLDRAASKPFMVQIDDGHGETLELPVGRQGLRRILLWDIGDGNDLPWFPALIHQLGQGNTESLAWFVRKRYFQIGAGVPLMSLAMDCASGVSAERRARIEAEAPSAAFGNVMNDLYEHVCSAIGVPQLDQTFREPIHSSVETLFVSGTIDSNTPPYQAEEVRWGMINGHHLIVIHAGHEDMLPDPRVREAIATFFRSGEVPVTRVVLPRPAFIAVDQVRR